MIKREIKLSKANTGKWFTESVTNPKDGIRDFDDLDGVKKIYLESDWNYAYFPNKNVPVEVTLTETEK